MRAGEYSESREKMVAIGRLMYEHGLIAGTDGNLSLRLDNSCILATAAGVPKGRMRLEDIVVTDAEGRSLSGTKAASSEIKVHLAAYACRPDVGAVVHAHPPAALALSLAGIEMEPPVAPESLLALGPIATAEYRTPGTASLAETLEEVLRCHHAIIMERHGALTLGRDLDEAYCRMESLEHTAKTLWMARVLGPVKPLSDGEIQTLGKLAVDAGSPPPALTDASCRTTGASMVDSEIRSLVLEVLGRVRERG